MGDLNINMALNGPTNQKLDRITASLEFEQIVRVNTLEDSLIDLVFVKKEQMIACETEVLSLEISDH